MPRPIPLAAPVTSAVCSSRRKLGMVMAVPFACWWTAGSYGAPLTISSFRATQTSPTSLGSDILNLWEEMALGCLVQADFNLIAQDQLRRFLRGLAGTGSRPGVQFRMLDRSRNSSELMSPRAKRSARMPWLPPRVIGEHQVWARGACLGARGTARRAPEGAAAACCRETAAWTKNSPIRGDRGLPQRACMGALVNLSLDGTGCLIVVNRP